MLFYLNEDMFVNEATLSLVENGIKAELQEKCVRVLIYLIKNRSRIVPQDELIMQIWNNNYGVGKQGVLRSVSMIRKAIGDNPKRPKYIVTHRLNGYQFIFEEIRESSAKQLPDGIKKVLSDQPTIPAGNAVNSGFISRASRLLGQWFFPDANSYRAKFSQND